ncbi:DUF6898 family protein [Magnetospirillum molischianum]|uniref:DUF6898 domain-containing protein n=1 Tax=Magnetospirillum molischianum DSM 120 TaxID=1150626 RepID=H8FUU2_MAGML|nr:hypothetical protein [Magnetospirillum molischianum]CCG42130.1 conserved hypothetical protein [Magnetospirillum molischianum DSM 120]
MTVSGEVLFEFRRVGALVKVTAFHVSSMTEVSISGPASAGEAILRTQALRRLEYVMAKRAAEKS